MAGTDFPGKKGKRDIYDPTGWVVPYSDLITTLMIFFLLMYSVSASGLLENQLLLANIQKALGGKEITEEMKKKVEETKMADELKQYFKDTASVEINTERISIKLPSPVLFDTGSAEIKKQAISSLEEIANSIKSLSNTIIVEGHTDNIPITFSKYKSNWELSSARAFNVVKYFIEYHKIDPARFRIYGYGEFMPVAPNDTEENRAKNRRIEISILRIK